MAKILFLLIFFYLSAIIQTSFLVHYEIKGGSLNLVLISIILFNFFENKKSKSGLVIGGAGGFYLDVFSPYLPGIFTLLGIGTALLVRLLQPFFEAKKHISFFIILFIVLSSYEIILTIPTLIHGFYFNVFNLIYNFLVSIILYFLIKLAYAFSQKKIRK